MGQMLIDLSFETRKTEMKFQEFCTDIILPKDFPDILSAIKYILSIKELRGMEVLSFQVPVTDLCMNVYETK